MTSTRIEAQPLPAHIEEAIDALGQFLVGSREASEYAARRAGAGAAVAELLDVSPPYQVAGAPVATGESPNRLWEHAVAAVKAAQGTSPIEVEVQRVARAFQELDSAEALDEL